MYDANITLNSDSYAAETLSGYDDEGNQYSWFGGAWFHNEDITNGNVNILD